MVGTRGFEPPTTCTPSMCATRLRYVPTPLKLGKITEKGKTLQPDLIGIEEGPLFFLAFQQKQDFAQLATDLF